jgi:hypothetical protein
MGAAAMQALWDYDASIDALANPGLARDHFSGARRYARPALCAEMARLVYCDDHAYVDTALARAGFGKATWFRQNGTDAMLAENGEFAVLAFRGTESPRIRRLFAGIQMPSLSRLAGGELARNLPELVAGATPQLRTLLTRVEASVRDVLTDLDALPEDWPGGGKVHRGFAAALRCVWGDIAPALNGVSVPVLYTGHSLGAALATLAAGLRPTQAVYAFGSPRVGDADFVGKLANTAIQRYVNCCDIVCRLPPGLYQPAGSLHYIDAAGGLDVIAESEDVCLEARIRHFRRHAGQWDKVWFRDLADHAAANYLAALLLNG